MQIQFEKKNEIFLFLIMQKSHRTKVVGLIESSRNIYNFPILFHKIREIPKVNDRLSGGLGDLEGGHRQGVRFKVLSVCVSELDASLVGGRKKFVAQLAQLFLPPSF